MCPACHEFVIIERFGNESERVMTYQLKKGLLFLLLVVVALCATPFVADVATVVWLGSEDGPLEQGSVWLWFVAGFWVLGRNARVRRWLPVAFGLVMIMMGVRETGLPPELVPSGKALLSWRYYADANIDPLRRLITGGTILILLTSLIASVWSTVRYVFREQGWRYADAQFLILAFLCLLLGQLAERGAGHDGAALSSMLSLMLEEGFEALGAVFALVACALPRVWFLRPAQTVSVRA